MSGLRRHAPRSGALPAGAWARIRPGRAAGAVVLLLLAAACGGAGTPEPPPLLATPVRVSGASPFAAGCNGAVQAGTRWPGSEVEPHLAVHPLAPDHLVAAWQQDRWSNGGADGDLAAVSLDGGLTWTPSMLPFTRCAGGAAPAGDHERASDPWVGFSHDGAIVHAVGLAFDRSTPRSSIVVSRSTDGGLTWSPAQAVETERSTGVALDKPTLTADPGRPGYVYAVWDRLTGLTGAPADARGPARLARSTDGGASWEAARTIHDPGPDAQTIASQVVVLPDGALVDVFVRILQASAAAPVFEVVAIRSEDAGTTWSAEPVVVSALRAVGTSDPGSGHAVRTGTVVPSSTVDGTGRLWVAWQDGRFSDLARDGIALAVSEDGGRTFSAPVRVNGAPAVQAFRPAVAGGPGGEVAVSYYDFRPYDPADPGRAWTAAWLATSADGGATWAEVPIGGPFDLRSAPDAEGYFLGDYTGLVARRGGFHALFSMGRPAAGGDASDAWASGP